MSRKQPVMSHDPLAELVDPAMNVDQVSPEFDTSTDGPSDAGSGAVPPGEAILKLPASLTIADVAGLHATLMDYLTQGVGIELDGSEVELIDGAGVQLLAAAAKSANDKALAFNIDSPTSVLARAVSQIGLSALLGFGGQEDAA